MWRKARARLVPLCPNAHALRAASAYLRRSLLPPHDAKRVLPTLLDAHRLLRLVLGYAVKSGTLSRNVAAVESPPAVEERELRYYPLSRSRPCLSL
jgi:hypothetical protein